MSYSNRRRQIPAYVRLAINDEARRDAAAKEARQRGESYRTLRARVEASPAWTTGIAAMTTTTREIVAQYPDAAEMVGYLRLVGGWTVVLKAAFAAAAGEATVEGPFASVVPVVTQLTETDIAAARNAGLR